MRSSTGSRESGARIGSIRLITLALLLIVVIIATDRQLSLLLLLSKEEDQTEDDNSLDWYWTSYGNSNKILIAQQAGNVEYYRNMLDITQRANRAYARKWQCDYVALTGLALGGYQNYHANFNKIQVLQTAAEKGYEVVLLLDADALITDVNHDIRQDISAEYALSATTGHMDNPHSWQFNAGVVLWNLSHSRASSILKTWQFFARISILLDLQSISERFSGDQTWINVIVWWNNKCNPRPIIDTRQGIFDYIRHVMRHYDSRFQWELPNGDGSKVDARTSQLQKLVDEVCQRKEDNGSTSICDTIPTKLVKER